MSKTAEDIKLLECLDEKIALFNIARPYVWELKLSQNDFDTLHLAITQSIASHAGSISHLLTRESAVRIIIYLAEWYKRCYQSGSGDNKAIDPDSEQLKALWAASGLDIDNYVYRTEGGNHLWQYSTYVLGGLAIKHELGKSDRKFLKALCRILNNDNYTLENLEDESRAIAFRSSINNHHSLYYFLSEIVNGNCPYHASDVENANSDASQLIESIKRANDEVLKKKFRFEWVVYHQPQGAYMSRKLRLWLNTEKTGKGLHQYLRYDRMLLWGFDNPTKLERLFISVKFLDKETIVADCNFEKPLIAYVNTGDITTGFVSLGVSEFCTCKNIPSAHFTKVEIWAKDNLGNEHRIQEQECSEWMQLWRVDSWSDWWSSRQAAQKETAVAFSQACQIKLNNPSDSLESLPFRDSKYGYSENFYWYNIYDNVTIVDQLGKEITLYNRIGYDQIYTKLYHDVVQYEAGSYVKHIAESDDEDFEATEELIPLIFRKDDIFAMHFETKSDVKNARPTADCKIDSIHFKSGGRFYTWDDEQSPAFGVIDLAIYVKEKKFALRAYYAPSYSESATVVRDFENSAIKYANWNGSEVSQMVVVDKIAIGDKPLAPTRAITIGSESDYIVLNIIRPTLIREVCRNEKVVKIFDNQDVVIPYRFKDELAVNCFTQEGYQSYKCSGISSIYTLLGVMEDAHLDAWMNEMQYNAQQMDQYAPACLKVAFGESRYEGNAEKFYKWNYYSDAELEECSYDEEAASNSVIFHSRTNADSVACIAPKRGGFRAFGYKRDRVCVVKCFEVALQHNLYFFELRPLTKIEDYKTELYDPLIAKRGDALFEVDKQGLRRLADECKFDWKEKYKIEI